VFIPETGAWTPVSGGATLADNLVFLKAKTYPGPLFPYAS